jgi:hypothetical protein
MIDRVRVRAGVLLDGWVDTWVTDQMMVECKLIELHHS